MLRPAVSSRNNQPLCADIRLRKVQRSKPLARRILVREPGFETLCAHHGEDTARQLGAAAPPIYQCSTFISPDVEAFVTRHARHPDAYDYTRVANPTTDILEAKLAALEQTDSARAFGSGMAAISAAVLNCVRAGDHVVAVRTIYGPTRALLSSYLDRFGVSVTYVRGTDPGEFDAASTPATRLYYLESPSTFVFHLQDIAAIARIARERGITTIVDNSWATPYWQNPIALGADLVVHSATKYLGGHSDIVAGVVMGGAERVAAVSSQEGSLLGGILDPFASWLMLRGLRTLALRMERHQESALRVAQYLSEHPRVAHVYYPGLSTHPQHALALRQMRGFSGLLSFALKDGGQAAAAAFCNALRYFGIAVSWGGFESLCVPAQFPAEETQVCRPLWGARLSIGLETVDDLLEDLDQALASLPR